MVLMEKNEYEEKAFENLLRYAFSIAGKQMADELEDPEEEHVFSKEHERKMQKLFDGERKRLRKKMFYRNMKKVAVFLLLIITVSSVSVFSVEAWRLEFFRFILDVKETYTGIQFEESTVIGNSYSSEEITLEYVPEGFHLDSRTATKNKLFLVFAKEQEYFNFTQREPKQAISLDTENATLEKLKINGNEAYVSIKNGTNILVWHDNNKTFSVDGNIDSSELVKIAENVKNKK